MLIQQIIMGFCAFSLSFTVFAVDKVKPETTRAAPSGGMYLALGKMNIDSTVANKENVKDSASYIRLGVDSMSKH